MLDDHLCDGVSLMIWLNTWLLRPVAAPWGQHWVREGSGRTRCRRPKGDTFQMPQFLELYKMSGPQRLHLAS